MDTVTAPCGLLQCWSLRLLHGLVFLFFLTSKSVKMSSRTFHLKTSLLSQSDEVKALLKELRDKRTYFEDTQSEFRAHLATEMAKSAMPTLYTNVTSIKASDLNQKGEAVYKYEGARVHVTVDEIAAYKLPDLRLFVKDRLTFVFRPCKANGHRNPYAVPITFTLLELKNTKAFHR